MIGFRFLSQKHKVYNRKALTSHFINFLKTYEDLYQKKDRMGKNGYLNAIKFIYQHFKGVSEYSLQNVKDEIEISLKLKRENLDYKNFGETKKKTNTSFNKSIMF